MIMGKIIRLTDQDVANIIKEAVSNILKENTNSFEILTITDPREIEGYISAMWNIMQLSYEHIGGFKSASNIKDFQRNIDLAKLVIANDKVIACATYRSMGGYKMTGIGCDQTQEGKNALQEIIKDNISNFKDWYWAEVSGAVEYFFKKHDGYPLPNIYIPTLFGPSKKIQLLDDGVHYLRTIGVDGIEYKKMIFGFRDKELYDKVQQEVENYDDFMKEVNNLHEYYQRYDLQLNKAIFIIENIHRLHYEDEFNEIPQSWYNALLEARQILEKCISKDETIEQYLKTSAFLLDELQILKLHKFNF